MPEKFAEALESLKVHAKSPTKRIKLVNNQILHGTITDVKADMIVVKMAEKGAGAPTYTVPTTAILYISDSELE